MMKIKKLETYEPRKKFIEKVVPLLKPGFRIFIVLSIVVLTVFATQYAVDLSDEVLHKDSNQITGRSVYQNHAPTERSLSTPTKTSVVIPSPVLDVINTPTDYSTLISDLLRSDIVSDLPEGAVLRLQFYNFDSGIRVWERSYSLERDSVKEGDIKGDIQIIMDSKYVSKFKTKSACAVLTSANNNGDFGADTDMSDSALIWKYKSMMKYRDCLGI